MTAGVLDPRSGAVQTYGETVATREGRYRARTVLRGLSRRHTVQKCGLVAVQEGGIGLRVQATPDGLSAGWSGLATCGSPWVCPVCSAKIAARRMLELGQAVEAHTNSGGSLAMLTVTMRHKRGQSLRKLWDGMSAAWRHFVRSGSYRRLVDRLGVAGYVRATEVTHGQNGWHVHFHVLYFLEPQTLFSEVLVDTIASTRAQLTALWTHAVESVGFSATHHGQDFRAFFGGGEALRAAAEYLVKSTYTPASVGAEVAGGAYKTGRQGGRTPFGIASGLVLSCEAEQGFDPDDLSLWLEFDDISAGRRQLIWSRGLRERLGLTDVLTDEQAAALELEGEDVLVVPANMVRRLTRSGVLMSWVLLAAESCVTVEAARRAAGDVLTAHGVAWQPRLTRKSG